MVDFSLEPWAGSPGTAPFLCWGFEHTPPGRGRAFAFRCAAPSPLLHFLRSARLGREPGRATPPLRSWVTCRSAGYQAPAGWYVENMDGLAFAGPYYTLAAAPVPPSRCSPSQQERATLVSAAALEPLALYVPARLRSEPGPPVTGLQGFSRRLFATADPIAPGRATVRKNPRNVAAKHQAKSEFFASLLAYRKGIVFRYGCGTLSGGDHRRASQ